MKKILLLSLFVITLFMTSCRSDECLMKACRNYLDKKYHFAYTITQPAWISVKDLKPEWKSFTATTKKDGKPIEFHVYVHGILWGTISGDDYPQQENALEVAKKFSNDHADFLAQSKFSNLMYEAWSDQYDNQYSVSVDQEYLSLNDDSSLNSIVQLVNSLEQSKIDIKSFSVNVLSLDHRRVLLSNLRRCSNLDELKKYLQETDDAFFIYYALYEKDRPVFQKLVPKLNALGYPLFDGDPENAIAKGSINRYPDRYSLVVRGNDQHIVELVKLLQSQPIRIARITVMDPLPNQDPHVVFSLNISKDQTEEEIREMLKPQSTK